MVNLPTKLSRKYGINRGKYSSTIGLHLGNVDLRSVFLCSLRLGSRDAASNGRHWPCNPSAGCLEDAAGARTEPGAHDTQLGLHRPGAPAHVQLGWRREPIDSLVIFQHFSLFFWMVASLFTIGDHCHGRESLAGFLCGEIMCFLLSSCCASFTVLHLSILVGCLPRCLPCHFQAKVDCDVATWSTQLK